jgi:glycosyltransferase involved in cell wall biosynthesis
MPGVGSRGGVQQFAASLVNALGRLSDGPEEYLVIGPRHGGEWLPAILGPNQRLVTAPAPPSGSLEYARELVGRLHLPLDRLYRRLQVLMGRPLFSYHVPRSSGFYESLGGDLVHFPHQRYVDTGLPSVYNPHDLQYVHYPEFFTKHELAEMDVLYRHACGSSVSVAAESVSVKNDVSASYGTSPGKIQVIFRGPPTELYDAGADTTSLARTRDKFGLMEPFIFYPAQTWPHKNHLRLLEALDILRRNDGLKVRLVCTGSMNYFWPTIRAAITRMGLSEQVSFLGFVQKEELQALYRLAQFVIFPSLFEGGGFPVLEALRAGTPLACSDIAPLREYAGEAALFLDPGSAEGIARAIAKLAGDEGLRAGLRRKGHERVGAFSWDATARTYRALYRKVAGRTLGDEDTWYLKNNGMKAA